MFYNILPLLFLLPTFILANPAPILGIGIGRTQSAGVEGILTCEGKPASNVLVKLYDDDRGIDTDDLMEGRREKGGGNEPANAANKWSFLGAVVKLTAKLFAKWFSINKKKSVENEPSNPKENLPSRNKRWESGKARKNGTILAEGRTDDEGHFKLEGYTQEITDIDPKINVYHDCNDFKPCQRKISIMIPDKYITSGEHPKKYYDAGTIELEGKFKGEERDCIH